MPVADLKERAESGDTFAQVVLGYLYENGFKAPLDKEAAQAWYERAADRGYPPAQLALAALLDRSDPERSLHWVEQAAEAGYPAAQALLGACYWGDSSLAKSNPKLAFSWVKLAADQGDFQSMIALALMYEEGICVEKNQDLARDCLTRAAKLGSIAAASMIGGRLVDNPEPGKQTEGLEWIWIAAKNGDRHALNCLAIMYQFRLYGSPKRRELAFLFLELSWLDSPLIRKDW